MTLFTSRIVNVDAHEELGDGHVAQTVNQYRIVGGGERLGKGTYSTVYLAEVERDVAGTLPKKRRVSKGGCGPEAVLVQTVELSETEASKSPSTLRPAGCRDSRPEVDRFGIKQFWRNTIRRREVPSLGPGGQWNQETQEDVVAREAAILSKIAHPSIVRLVEVIDDPLHSSLYHVFELLQRPDLMFWVEDRWSVTDCDDPENYDVFTLSAAVSITKQVLSGVEYLHSRNIVHKDLKPNNIGLAQALSSENRLRARGTAKQATFEALLAGEGATTRANLALETVKIYDFGCAEICRVADPTAKKLTVYSAGGTTMFWPPEAFLIDEDDGIDGGKRDLWSVGAVLFCMLFGFAPYWDESPIQMQLAIMSQPLAYPAWFSQGIDRGGDEGCSASPALAQAKVAFALLQSLLHRDETARGQELDDIFERSADTTQTAR